jgi:hypothetical protein
MRKLYLLLLNLLVAGIAYSQCNNSIELKKTSVDSNPEYGSIELEVSTSKEFICILSIEKGSGPEKISEKRERGSQIIRFESIKRNEIYQVQFEFIGEEEPLCKKLQKSHIIIE